LILLDVTLLRSAIRKVPFGNAVFGSGTVACLKVGLHWGSGFTFFLCLGRLIYLAITPLDAVLYSGHLSSVDTISIVDL